jgi:hypothetical protein
MVLNLLRVVQEELLLLLTAMPTFLQLAITGAILPKPTREVVQKMLLLQQRPLFSLVLLCFLLSYRVATLTKTSNNFSIRIFDLISANEFCKGDK